MRRFWGPPLAGRRYIERPGVYAVIRSRGEVLIVEWEGQFHLPGEGVDRGEGTLAALHRECLEETGWRIRVERRMGAFQRYLYASEPGHWLRKVYHVYLARPALRIGGPHPATAPSGCRSRLPCCVSPAQASGLSCTASGRCAAA